MSKLKAAFKLIFFVLIIFTNTKTMENNQQDIDNRMRFFCAIKDGYFPIVKSLLIKKTVSPNAINSENESALYVAAKFGRTSMVELLLQYGAKVTEKEFNLIESNYYTRPNIIETIGQAFKEQQPKKCSCQDSINCYLS